MPLQPSIPDLANFLNSCLNAKQLRDLIGMLDQTDSTALDPETAPGARGPRPTREPIAVPATIQDLLQEMEAAYSIDKFPDLSAEESRRVRDAHPGFIERCSAYQGRHLVRMIKDRLKSI